MSIKVDLGCGANKVVGCIGVDNRLTSDVNVLADILHLPFKDKSIDEIYCNQVLEHYHLKEVYTLLTVIWRLLKNDGKAYISVPNWGTYSAVSDPSHKFTTDLNHWAVILEGYFRNILVNPVSVRFQSASSKWIKKQQEMIKDGFYDMAQGFKFICSNKYEKSFGYGYVPWYLENEISDLK